MLNVKLLNIKLTQLRHTTSLFIYDFQFEVLIKVIN